MQIRVWNETVRPAGSPHGPAKRAFYCVGSPSEAWTVIEHLRNRHRYEQFGDARDEFGVEVLSHFGWKEWQEPS